LAYFGYFVETWNQHQSYVRHGYFGYDE